MTSQSFRRIALSLPETTEGEHMNHPDFRVRKRIFATLRPGLKWGVVMLTPEQQHRFVKDEPEVFVPVNGGWGRRGATQVLLKSVKAATLRKALKAAWRNEAPDELLEEKD